MTSRKTAASGAALGLLLVVGLLLTSTPDTSDADGAWRAYFTDGGHQARLIASGILLVLAGYAFVAFASGLRERGPGAPLGPRLATLAGALMAVAGVLTMLVPASLTGDNSAYVPDADVLRIVAEMGYAVLAIAAMPAAAIALALLTADGTLPRPLVIAGRTICVLQLGALWFFPMLLLGLWAIAAAAVMARRPLKVPLPA